MNYQTTEIIAEPGVKITNFLNKLGIGNIRNEIIQGLTSTQKYISSKFFYDKRGSKLFEEITRLPEYYPTRTEKQILNEIAPELMGNMKHTDIVELGSGDCSKISILLRSVPQKNMESVTYMPMDVSTDAIQTSSEKLVSLFPGLHINGFVADFINQLDLIPANRKRIFFFLGSTLGNFNEGIANRFLQNLSRSMNKGDTFLLGIDLVKEAHILHRAYNDSKGITAGFNKNILHVVNRIIESDFNTEYFEHKAFYNKNKSRIEMHLVAQEGMVINTPFHEPGIIIRKGENIHTEDSYKYSFEKFGELENASGLKVKEIFTDTNKWFALLLFEK